MKKKVVILANNSGGLYDFRGELITELLKENEVVVSVPEDDKVEELKQLGVKFISTNVNRRSMNLIQDFKLFWTYIKILRTEKPELVITYTIKPNIYGGIAARILRISYAVNITGLGTAFQKQGLLRKIVTILYKVALRRAKCVFFENQENMQVFTEAHIVKRKKCCLLNGAGVNLEKFSYTEYPKDIAETRFLFVGRIMREKGVDELFSACRRLYSEGYPISLDVLGNCEEDYINVMEEYETEGWLKYHGYQTDVRTFIATAHCFVLPSWHEGMANTNLECAAMGRPVITSDIHGCKEAVIDGASGYLCQKQNVNNLYEIMKRFIELHDDTREKMGRAGRDHMEEVFNKKKIVKNTIQKL